MRNRKDRDDDIDEAAPEKPPVDDGPVIDGMLLMRLRDCAISTRVGMVDRGFPTAMGRLHAMSLVNERDGGHVVSQAGIALLDHPKIKAQMRVL